MEPGLLNGAKMREEVKYQIEGEEHRDSVSFYVASMSWEYFWTFNRTEVSPNHCNMNFKQSNLGIEPATPWL